MCLRSSSNEEKHRMEGEQLRNSKNLLETALENTQSELKRLRKSYFEIEKELLATKKANAKLSAVKNKLRRRTSVDSDWISGK